MESKQWNGTTKITASKHREILIVIYNILTNMIYLYLRVGHPSEKRI